MCENQTRSQLWWRLALIALVDVDPIAMAKESTYFNTNDVQICSS